MKFRNCFHFKYYLLAIYFIPNLTNAQVHIIQPLPLQDVTIQDAFWSPKLKVWDTKTVYDVLDKLEGKYETAAPVNKKEKGKSGPTNNAFLNFDRVAHGDKNTKLHDGPPWYDGLVYETIRGAADLLAVYPDARLQKKIDAYIVRIAKAQAADSDGYIDTYTTLTYSDRRWGKNGGDDKWQHDIYNAGMLAEAAVHYYKATHTTRLLNIAAKMSNYMYSEMGPAPKKNVIPGHGGPEEALLKMYLLFKKDPQLKKKLTVPVNEDNYYKLAKYWIENRGHYTASDGGFVRTNDSSYNEDHLPVFDQQTIEGHAVRATLLATGVSAMAVQNGDARYINTANNYWDNMIGKRMFITGGQGAVAEGERFGANYYLPESAYLETCASIGSAFFSEEMNQLKADGKYIDEFERVLYNNLLSGVSLSGDHYHYENPLTATDHPRWGWHGCPCCPPMILKMVGAVPGYIYATDDAALYVNLFIGSNATLSLKNVGTVTVQQVTNYPWKGKSLITINPASPKSFTVKVRVPGWANGEENPFGLYHSANTEKVVLKLNGKQINYQVENGYAAISLVWKKGDMIEINIPVQPRMVMPSDSVTTIKGKIAVLAGPVVYGFEAVDNPALNEYSIRQGAPLQLSFKPGLLNGVNTISGTANTATGTVKFTAIPFYAIGNRGKSYPYKVWLPQGN